jgi:hypothetical protein
MSSLACFSLFEFIALVDAIPKTADQPGEEVRRKKNLFPQMLAFIAASAASL